MQNFQVVWECRGDANELEAFNVVFEINHIESFKKINEGQGSLLDVLCERREPWCIGRQRMNLFLHSIFDGSANQVF